MGNEEMAQWIRDFVKQVQGPEFTPSLHTEN